MVDLDVRAAVHRLVLFGLSGLGVAALGLVVLWVTTPSLFAPAPFPPGLIFLALTAIPMWLDRRAPRSPMAGFLIAAWILVGGLWEGEIGRNLGSGDPGVVIGTVMLIAGLVASSVIGVLSVLPGTTAARADGAHVGAVGLPRRLPRLLAAAGMLLDAVGDALPEGLRPDGPGPVLFLVLAVMVAAVPDRAVVAVAGLLSLALLIGGFTSAELPARLAAPSRGLYVAGAWLQLVGLVAAVLCAVLALLPVRRPG